MPLLRRSCGRQGAAAGRGASLSQTGKSMRVYQPPGTQLFNSATVHCCRSSTSPACHEESSSPCCRRRKQHAATRDPVARQLPLWSCLGAPFKHNNSGAAKRTTGLSWSAYNSTAAISNQPGCKSTPPLNFGQRACAADVLAYVTPTVDCAPAERPSALVRHAAPRPHVTVSSVFFCSVTYNTAAG